MNFVIFKLAGRPCVCLYGGTQEDVTWENGGEDGITIDIYNNYNNNPHVKVFFHSKYCINLVK